MARIVAIEMKRVQIKAEYNQLHEMARAESAGGFGYRWQTLWFSSAMKIREFCDTVVLWS